MRDFYEKLYSKSKNLEESDYKPTIQPKNISDSEKALLDKPISQKELDNALKCHKKQ